jgi:hypothetical protein
MMKLSPKRTERSTKRALLRRFQVGDLLLSHLSAVRSMYRQLHRMHARAMPDRFCPPGPSLYSDDELLGNANHANGFLLTARAEDDEVFGFASARFHTRQADSRRVRRAELCIDTIYVKPSLRGIRELPDGQRVHIASSLFGALTTFALESECDDLVFDVWDFNHSSMKFCMAFYQTALNRGVLSEEWPIYFDNQSAEKSLPRASPLRMGSPSLNVKFYLPLEAARASSR